MGKRRIRISASWFGHQLVDFPLSLFDFWDPGYLNFEQHTPVQLLVSQKLSLHVERTWSRRASLEIYWLVWSPTKTSNKSGGEASYASSSHESLYIVKVNEGSRN